MFSYERQRKQFSVAVWLRSMPMQAYGYLLFRLMYFGSYLPYKLSLWLSVKLLFLVRTYSRFFGPKSAGDQEK
jgi:quinol-cytochrome oxidoreductase complex cytochrome b subunit